MSLVSLIKSRRSIRAFEKRIPPKELIEECLEAAVWAPSASNLQPWEFVVLGGEALKKVNQITLDNVGERMAGLDPFAETPEPIQSRQLGIMRLLSKAALAQEINPTEIFEKMMVFFDAPIGVYFVTYKINGNQYDISTAAAVENFLLAAHEKGLGTCWLNLAIVCEEEIKAHLGIGEDKKLLAGIALGYPDKDSLLNTFDRPRIPVDSITRWLGF